MRARATWILAALLGASLLGCVEPAPAARPPAVCERLGDRCQLAGGPIGICSETSAPCDEPPCLACMSQH